MSCARTPASTQFTIVTSTGTITSFSDAVTTLPSEVLTTVTGSCVASIGSNTTTCLSSADVTLTTTLGVPSIVQVPVTVANLITQTLPASTVFASCSDSQVSQSTMSSSSSSTSTSSAPTSAPISSLTTAGTLPVVVTQIITSVQPSSVSSTPSSTPTSVQNNNDGTRLETNAVPIIGGAFGGFLGLIGLVGLLWFLIRRRKRWGYTYENENDFFPAQSPKDRHGRFGLDADVEPKPYQYGLVGYTSSPSLVSPPGSPLVSASKGNDAASHGGRRSSISPLILPASTSRPYLDSGTASSSRPSASGSTQSTVREFIVTRPTKSTAHHPQTSSASSRLSQIITVSNSNPMAEFGYLDGLDRAGSPTSIHEPRRQLQIVNTPLSPVSLDSQGDMLSGVSSGVAVNKKGGKLRNSGDVVVHTDGGRVDLDGTGMGVTNQPPAYNP